MRTCDRRGVQRAFASMAAANEEFLRPPPDAIAAVQAAR